MTINYLQKTVSASIDANGNATALLKPDVGQFWAPSLVQISTQITPFNSALTNSAVCVLYRGAVGPSSASSYIDDTFNGSGDSSSIIAGTVVMYGEGITAKWTNGTVGDTAIMVVYGRTADNLIELQDVLSPIPGTRFAGNAGNTMVWEYNDFVDAGPNNIFTVPPTFTTPFNLLCELVSVQYKVATNATVATRGYGLNVLVFDGVQNVTLASVFEGAGQVASTTVTYNFEPGIQSYSVGASPNINIGTSIPSKLILPPGTTVVAAKSGSVSGDTWTGFQVIYRQYKTLTKVGTT